MSIQLATKELGSSSESSSLRMRLYLFSITMMQVMTTPADPQVNHQEPWIRSFAIAAGSHLKAPRLAKICSCLLRRSCTSIASETVRRMADWPDRREKVVFLRIIRGIRGNAHGPAGYLAVVCILLCCRLSTLCSLATLLKASSSACSSRYGMTRRK